MHLVIWVSQEVVHEQQKCQVLTHQQVYSMVDASNPVASVSKPVLIEQ